MKKYGLIGYPLTHSFSQKYFSEKFISIGLTDHAYENFELRELDDLKKIIRQNNLNGFNITIPHKEGVIAFLDEKDEVVETIGAANCVKIVNEKWKGYNTDVIGFKNTFSPGLLPHHTHALILGTGGASKAIEYVLKKLQIGYLFVSTSRQGGNIIGYDDIDEGLLEQYTIIINTTPLGMHPNTLAYPQLPYEFISPRHYFFDLVYNPAKTMFLLKGEERGAIIKNGYEMLIIQAEESWTIWNAV